MRITRLALAAALAAVCAMPGHAPAGAATRADAPLPAQAGPVEAREAAGTGAVRLAGGPGWRHGYGRGHRDGYRHRHWGGGRPHWRPGWRHGYRKGYRRGFRK